MNLISFLKNLTDPPKCAGCGERFDILGNNCNDAFCQNCRSKWEKAKRRICQGCKHEDIDCTCPIKAIKGTKLLSLMKFSSEGCCVNFIYRLKQSRNERFFGFAADELYKRLLHEGKLMNEDYSDYVFVNVPRNARTKNLYGFDHAALLAEKVALKIGGRYDAALGRRWGGRPQKKLQGDKRMKNVKGRFVYRSNESIVGEKVILIDDVVTTGATASECVKELKRNGAAEVILLSIARASSSKKRRTKNKTAKGENDGAV